MGKSMKGFRRYMEMGKGASMELLGRVGLVLGMEDEGV